MCLVFENNQKGVRILETTFLNDGNSTYDFKIFRNLAIANVQIEPNSNIAPNISAAVYKPFSLELIKSVQNTL